MKKILYAAALISAISFTACQKTNDDASGTTRLSVYLTDDPSVYSSVFVDIKEVRVKYSDDTTSTDDGWKTLPLFKPGVYDLLRFSNGKDTILSTTDVPSGTIKQVRLVLGSNNSVVENGVSYPLETPSAQQSGLKIKVNFALVSGIDYKVWLDFDAGKSVVKTGNGKYILKPVIKAFTQATTGSIKGTIAPIKNSGWIYAIQNTSDTVASALADTLSGNFLLPGLAGGTYKVAIKGTNNYKDTTLSNVNVTVGSITNVGTIQLKQ